MIEMVMIKITNTSTEPSCPKLIAALEGKTYMDLHVIFCPVGGSFDVCVETQYDTTEDDLKDMVLGILSYDLIISG